MLKSLSVPVRFWKICAAAVIIRIVFSLGFSNLHSENYWEYGEIGKNIVAGKGYSFFYFQDAERLFRFSQNSTPFPSAYMPPGYVAYLLPFLTIENVVIRNILILCSHIAIAFITLGIFFHFTRIHFSENIALLSILIFAVLPDFIYAVVSFTPTVLFHCGIILVLITLNTNKSFYVYSVMLGIVLVLMVYLRSEVFLLVILLIVIFIIQNEWRRVFIVTSTVVILLAPWTLRNYTTFHSFVPFTTTAGLNLYRGNNPIEIGAWGDETLKQTEKLLPQNEQYEIEFNEMYIRYSSNYIKGNLFEVVKNTPDKLFDLWIYNRHYEKSNFIYNVYSLIFFLLFFFGSIKSYSSKHKYIYLIFLFFSIFITIFFCRPRYQTMMRIAMIPFVAIGIEFLYSFIKIKYPVLMRQSFFK